MGVKFKLIKKKKKKKIRGRYLKIKKTKKYENRKNEKKNVPDELLNDTNSTPRPLHLSLN